MTHPRADNFDVLSFDCYGTLVDWESAITQYMQQVLLAHDVHVFDDTILEFYAEWEPLEQGVGGRYRDVLQRVMDRYGARLGFTPSDEEKDGFVQAIASAAPFDDATESLPFLAEKFDLAIISNTDKDLISITLQSLPVQIAKVVTAEELGAYKPNRDMLTRAFAMISADGRKRVLHVAESQYHDIEPATELGLSTVWINRDRSSTSATRETQAKSTWQFNNLKSFANAFD